ncbi:glycosyl hydrolase family 65 protein [uncultured Vagococcus sp.]|uniref:glycoside hydrolase family 65 protein n=1 Tax=uncultured Vagococcus sp. TaxID=189676 RepID=UPI0028D8C1C6|nr:glycosyl hydrolase family 65 protein [uncultured Vagococcus sp.]
MNYIAIRFEECLVRLVSNKGLQLAVAQLDVNLENWCHEVMSLAEKIKSLDWKFNGIAIDLSKETLTDLEKTAMQSLSEGTNQPIVLASDLALAANSQDYFEKIEEEQTWTLDYYGYTPGKSEYSVESLLTTGNGFIGLRGTLPEMEVSEAHYPGTYLAGLYNGAPSVIEGRTVINEDFVNSPNLQYLSIKIENQPVLEINEQTIRSLHRHLDLRTGVFTSEAVLDSHDRQVKIISKRVVNMLDKHHYSISYEVTPLNFSGEITLISKSDGTAINFNTERYRSLTSDHLDLIHMSAGDTKTTVAVSTKQSKIQVIQHSELFGQLTESGVKNEIKDSEIIQTIVIEAEEGTSYGVEKSVTIAYFFPEESVNGLAYIDSPVVAKPFENNRTESLEAWKGLWEKADISVTGDLMSQKMIRLHTYHLLVSGSPIANQTLDVSITARGLHGEAYRGHIFWDEIFILPFYQLHFPDMAKQLIMYRYNRLAAAKENAKEAGYSGAMFPWQSGLDGTEQTQEVHLNPLNGQWGEDYSRLQRHVSLAIAYNVWNYWHNTGDRQFIRQYGAEMLLEIAEFWRSKAVWNDALNRYSIPNVMGPDEFHEAYPDSHEGGIRDNAYTNMMVVWLFEEIATLVTELTVTEFSELQLKTDITTEKIAEMQDIRQKLYLEINDEGIIAQYAGYFKLKEVDWDYYREKYGNIYRMDRILKADGKSADDYKVAKQADTLMTFYNLSKDKVDEIIADLNYQLPADYLEKNLDYYLQRTSHGSTLSRIVHAQLAEMVGKRELSWKLYQEALRSDYQDIQGGTTAEGIHTGVMAATLMVTLQTYGGVDSRGELLNFKPDLPNNWQGLRFSLTRFGVVYQVYLTPSSIEVSASDDVTVIIGNTTHNLTKNQPTKVTYVEERTK